MKPLISELQLLNTETHNKEMGDLVSMSTQSFIREMINDLTGILPIVEKYASEIDEIIEDCKQVLRGGGRIRYVGAGTSGRLGVLDASECPPTFGIDPSQVSGIIAGGDRALRYPIENAEDDTDGAIEDYTRFKVQSSDILIGISASGRTPYVLSMLEHHHLKGGKTTFIACNPVDKKRFLFISHIVDLDVGNEWLVGSTRMKSGTMTKIILNIISTKTLAGMGHVYKNYMVDLMATSEKLKARALKTLIELTQLNYDDAFDLLEKAGKSLKVALVMNQLSIGRTEAVQKLESVRGDINQLI